MIHKEAFKEIRKALKLTQEDLGLALGITREMIGLIERGEKPISSGNEAKISLLLQKENLVLLENGEIKKVKKEKPVISIPEKASDEDILKMMIETKNQVIAAQQGVIDLRKDMTQLKTNLESVLDHLAAIGEKQNRTMEYIVKNVATKSTKDATYSKKVRGKSDIDS